MAPVWIVLCLALSLHAQTTRPASRFDASTWRPLFDGTSLDGWTTKGGRYDGGAVWTVEDGVIVVSSAEQLRKKTLTIVYDIRDLLFEVPYFDNAPDFNLGAALQ